MVTDPIALTTPQLRLVNLSRTASRAGTDIFTSDTAAQSPADVSGANVTALPLLQFHCCRLPFTPSEARRMRFPRTLCSAAAALVALLIGTPIRAQVASVPSTGITVTGRGVVRVHADILRLLAYIGPVPQRGGLMRTGATTDSAAGVPAMPTALPSGVDAAADAIAKSLRDAGVADATAGMSATFNQAIGGRVITGTIHDPTRLGIDALVRAGNAAAANYPNVTLQNLVLSFYASDCGAAELRAQDAALSDARARAERAAHAAGVRLGSIVAVNEAAPSAFPTATLSQGCQTRPDTQFPAQQRNDGEGITNGDIFVTTIATVTFSIVR